MSKLTISIRKKEQLYNREYKEDIIVVYEDSKGLHEERFKGKTKEEIIEIYNFFNRTLKKGESKRFPKHFFAVETCEILTKLKK